MSHNTTERPTRGVTLVTGPSLSGEAPPTYGGGEPGRDGAHVRSTDHRALEFRRQDARLAEIAAARLTEPDIRKAWAETIAGLSSWTAFYSLTVDSKRYKDMTADNMAFLWRRLVEVLNVELYGKHYRRLVGHAYFDYAMVLENQKRGEWHIHALVNRRTHWELVHRWWENRCGFAWIEPVTDQAGSVAYLCKYITKAHDTEPHLFRSKAIGKEPKFKPLWYSGT